MLELPFPPAYQVKMVHGSEQEPAETPYVTRSHGDWGRTYEGQFGIHFEWIRIIPRLEHHVGMLTPHRIEDCTEELRSALNRLRLPFIEQDGFFTIYGHSKGVDLEYPTSDMQD